MLPAHQSKVVTHASCPPNLTLCPMLPAHQSKAHHNHKVVQYACCPTAHPMPIPTNQKVVPSVRYLPTKGHAQCLLPTNWSYPMLVAHQLVIPNTAPAAHQPNIVTHASCPQTKPCTPCFLPTNQTLYPMLPAHQSMFTCCSPIGCVQCLLPTKQWSPAAYQLVSPNACCPPAKRLCPLPQPKSCAQNPAVPPSNQKVVPNTSCPPTKTCPMLTTHQTKGWAPLLAAP